MTPDTICAASPHHFPSASLQATPSLHTLLIPSAFVQAALRPHNAPPIGSSAGGPFVSSSLSAGGLISSPPHPWLSDSIVQQRVSHLASIVSPLLPSCPGRFYKMRKFVLTAEPAEYMVDSRARRPTCSFNCCRLASATLAGVQSRRNIGIPWKVWPQRSVK